MGRAGLGRFVNPDSAAGAPEADARPGAGPRAKPGEKGSLVVVGTGIRVFGQLTVEAIAWMSRADRLLYVVGDPLAEEAVRSLNPGGAESLLRFYAVGKDRSQTYGQMVERILSWVRVGATTCAAFYGHPGVFAFPSHESIRRARLEGFSARMLPAVSAEDCLFADLGVDPADHGCQSYEATEFLLHGRTLDPTAAAVIWQIGIVGDTSYQSSGYDLSALPLLVARLGRFYPPGHSCVVYEAAVNPLAEPSIRPTTVAGLAGARLSAMSTLYIPPAFRPTRDPWVESRLFPGARASS